MGASRGSAAVGGVNAWISHAWERPGMAAEEVSLGDTRVDACLAPAWVGGVGGSAAVLERYGGVFCSPDWAEDG
jgi:hypothetical protein